MDKIKDFFNQNDRFCAHNDIKVMEVQPGYAKTEMEIKDYHLNGLKIIQGGAIFTLADLSFAAACNSHGTAAVAMQVNISFLKGVSSGTLTSICTETSRSNKIGHYHAEIKNEKGEKIALFHGVAYFLKDKLPLDEK
jgi:acyl-CoA thioesterase